MLQTLGGLRPLGDIRQPKPLLVLTYLALEGSTPRPSLARLFWPSSPRPLSNLSVALSTLRRCLPEAVEAGPDNVSTAVSTDVHRLFSALEAGDEAGAAELYRGPFLLGVDGPELNPELEEWVLGQRESIAERYRSTLLRWAEAVDGVAGSDRVLNATDSAARLADAVYRVTGAPPAHADTLRRAFTLLEAARHPTAAEVLKEAKELGLELTDTAADRRRKRSADVRSDGSTERVARPVPPPLSHGLIGREPERLEVQRLLTSSEVRLVTLHGPGGIGKSSLAIQVVNDLTTSEDPPFPGGIAFVELEAMNDAGALPFAIARALGRTSLLGQRGLGALRSVLPSARNLLVLDNLEQVSGASEAIERLLGMVPDVSVLATSRELLGLKMEVAFLLDGLRVPASARTEGAAAYDSVRLFAQVARRADASFELGPDQLPAAVRLCRYVGGSPLGIELAAAWVRSAPLDELANEVEEDLGLLRRNHSTGPHRHSSARASFDRSWNRLDVQHRRVLTALCAFSGGFTLSDAREVARVTLPQLARLVDAALLRVGAAGRYEQHPLVARFARERLASNKARETSVLDRHAEHFLNGLAARAEDLRVLRVGVLDAIDADFENISVAWHHAVGVHRADLVSASAFPLMRYADLRARLHEGQALLEAATSIHWPEDRRSEVAWGRGFAALAWVKARLGDHRAAIQAGDRARRLLGTRAWDDVVGLRIAQHALASSYYRAGDYLKAQDLYAGLLEGGVEDGMNRTELLGRLGLVAQAVGEYDLARERYLEALAANRDLGNVSGEVTQLLNLGALEMNSDSPHAARDRFEEALRLANDHGYQQVIPVLLHNLANLACKARRFGEAREQAHEALGMVVSSGERGLESGMLATLGWIEMEAGDLLTAEEHARRAVAIASGIGDEPAQQTALVRLGQVLLARGRSSEGAELLASASQHTATLTWARRLAQKLQQQVAS